MSRPAVGTVTWKGRSHLVLCLDFVWTGVMGRRRRKLSSVTKQMDRTDTEDMGAFEINSWVKRESRRVEDNGWDKLPSGRQRSGKRLKTGTSLIAGGKWVVEAGAWSSCAMHWAPWCWLPPDASGCVRARGWEKKASSPNIFPLQPDAYIRFVINHLHYGNYSAAQILEVDHKEGKTGESVLRCGKKEVAKRRG